MQNINKLLLPLVSIVIFLTCLFLSQERLVAGDEGYLLLAAKLVGKNNYTLYKDFFFPQMPLGVYVNATLFALFGVSFKVARVFQALVFCGVIFSASFVAFLIFKVSPNQDNATEKLSAKYNSLVKFYSLIFYSIIFLVFELTFPWYSTAQAYGLCSLALLILVILNSQNKRISDYGGLNWFVQGLIISLVISLRLYVGVVGVLCLLKSLRSSKKSLVYFLAGVSFGLLPVFILALTVGWDVFYLNNFGYHLLRSDLRVTESINQKLTVASSLFGLHDSKKYTGFLVPFIVWSGVLSWGLRTVRRRLYFDDYVGILIFIVSFIPTPCYFQYFSIAAPFLILSSTRLIAFIANDSRLIFLKLSYIFAVGVLCLFSSQSIHSYTTTGKGVIGIKGDSNPGDKKISSLDALARKINTLVPKDDFILTEWPGNIVGVNAKPVSGTENNFGYSMASALNKKKYSQKKKSLNLITKKEFNSLIKDRKVKWLLFRERYLKHKPRLRKNIVLQSYIEILNKKGMILYKLL